MRLTAIFALLTTVVLGASVSAQAPLGGPPPSGQPPGAPGGPPPGVTGRPVFAPLEQINKIADNLYLVPGQGGTSLVWVYSTGVLLVDTKVPQNGQKILELIRRVTDKPLTHVVITHAHSDHYGSTAEFPAGVEIVSHKNTLTHMLGSREFKDNPKAPGLPTRTFDDHLTLFGGKDAVELYSFGRLHTNGDTVVVFPAARAMHVGDIMKKMELPTVDAALGGSGVEFPAALQRMRSRIKNVDKVIGGHNDEKIISWNDFVRYGELAELFLAHEKASLRAGLSPEQTLADFKPPEKYQDFTLKGSTFGGVTAVQNTFVELQKSSAPP